MTSRKSRRNTERKTPKAGAKKQLVIMIICVILMVFSVAQVYYLARYTLGHDVPREKLKVYKWVYMLLEGNAATEK